MFRKILFWTHLVAGAVAGIIILIMSVTGVLLTYEKQIVAYVDRSAAKPGMASAAGAPETARIGVEALLTNVRSVRGAMPSNITLRADLQDPTSVTVGRDSVMVNPSTGQPISAPPAGARAFFRFVTDWHRWLGSTQENRQTSRTITGASNLLFLFIVVSGLYLWLPRKWAWPNVRAVLLFRGGLSGRARDFNWHNVAGFWCFVPLFFVVLSGVVISYPWASNMVYRAYGMEPPQQGKGKNKGAEGKGGEGRGGEGRGGDRAEVREKGVGPDASAKADAKGGERAEVRPGGERAEFKGGEGRRGKREGGASVDGAAERRGGALQEIRPEVSVAGLDVLVAKAKTQVPEWRTITFPIPASDKAPLVFNIDTGSGGQPQKKSTLTLDRATGNVVKFERFQDQEAGRQARSWMRFVHTGEYYGLTGQTIAGIASAAGALLVWTGIALALRRLFAWRDRRRRATASAQVGQVAA